ncbi:MAG: GtrA family protein [Clostridiales bacterium]|jgi:putative flippase GtrA|nr:GtrA family protein [Clostridiales bacterium]
MKKYWGPIKQFIKFNIVGISNTLVDFLVFTLCTGVLHIAYIAAKMISYCCGVINSYIWNSAWTFKKETKRTGREYGLFLLVNLVSLGVSLGAMYICRNRLNIESDFLCNIIAMPLSMVVNFMGNRLFVFREADKARAGREDDGGACPPDDTNQ